MCQNMEIDSYKKYQQELVEAGILIPSGVKGVYGRSGTFEKIVDGFQAYVGRKAAHLNAQVVHFPPVFNREHYLCTDHVHNFPDLMGSLHSFFGKEAEQAEMIRKLQSGEEWTKDLAPTQLMMAPAGCYPLYPASTGTLPVEGKQVDLTSFVFRHEPSEDPARMQIFRMREFVRMGTPEQALEHRALWLELGEQILKSLGLNVSVVTANDPFFGRGGRLRKATQREQDLKHEFVVPICSEEKPTAVGSCNYHMDSFSTKFKIKSSDGETAHSSCLGFGLERVTLALLKTHGLDVSKWPENVKSLLNL